MIKICVQIFSKAIVCIALFSVAIGCTSFQADSKDDDISRCIKLADSIELNGSKLVVTNGQLLIVFPADQN